MIDELSKKKRTELRAAVLFVKALGLEVKHEDFIFPEEADSVDVVYEPKKIKFQITSVDGGPNRLIRHNTYSWSVKLDEIIEKYIIEPITKKYTMYRGYGVSDVVLLIHSLNKPGRDNELEDDINKNMAEIVKIAKLSGFNSIYVVFDVSELVVPVFTINTNYKK